MGENMKSDPLQGILFKTKPVLLEERAVKRATKTETRIEVQSPHFYDKIQALKERTERLRRKKT